MKTEARPIYQAVLKYRYPVMAIASVLHRISGVILFLLIPWLLWVLSQSLASASGFEEIHAFLGGPLPITLIWICLAALIYHLLAGIRHMIMDFGYAESKQASRITAYGVMVITIVLLLFAGVWL